MIRNVRCISCGIFRKELKILLAEKKLDLKVSYLNSMLHMETEKLERLIGRVVDSVNRKNERAVILYGDCCPNMHEICSGNDFIRVDGINCCQIVLGRKRFRELISAGAFFLMPEWLAHWREIFQETFGFDPDSAKDFMRHYHKMLVYIDTGIEPLPADVLEELADFCGLSFYIENVTFEHLWNGLTEVLEKLNNGQ
ncbi:MAG: DUF1638 domain-containing protein [Desulfobacteraceae bacterium]|nr:DUF1638 domain-containing protein [Desulfobacteraceae bacterium]